jgi:hypothetical protein
LTQGAAGKKKRETDVHLRQLAKKNTHVPSFFLFFSAFLGASRQLGSSKTRGNKSTAFQNKSPEIFFRAEFFSGGFFCFFSFDLFVVALVKRLSVRELKNVMKNVLQGRASKAFPLVDFFSAFLGDFKKTRNRTSKQSRPNKVRTYIGFFLLLFSCRPL